MTRTHRHQAAIVVAFLLAFLAACVTWNGAAYQALAGDELVALSDVRADAPLNVDRCLALSLGAVALTETDGGSKSVKAPFFAGQHVEKMAAVHRQQGAVCAALVSREEAGDVTPEQRARSRAAWSKTWRNGRELLGGGSP
jgi:hypothetical protein